MQQVDYKTMTIAEIIRRWPAAIGVFIDLRMRCIGCPIGGFHTPEEAAAEHDLPLDLLLAELDAAIAGTRVRAGPVRSRPRSAAGDGGS